MAWFKDIAVSPVTIQLLFFLVKPSAFYLKEFPDLSFDALEDAQAAFIFASTQYDNIAYKKITYKMECKEKNINPNPRKLKKMGDDSFRADSYKRAIESVIDQFNEQPA